MAHSYWKPKLHPSFTALFINLVTDGLEPAAFGQGVGSTLHKSLSYLQPKLDNEPVMPKINFELSIPHRQMHISDYGRELIQTQEEQRKPLALGAFLLWISSDRLCTTVQPCKC